MANSQQPKSASSTEDKIQKFLDLEEYRDNRALDKNVIWRLFKDMWTEKKLLIAGNLFLIIATATTVYEPRLLGLIVDEALLLKSKERLILLLLVFLSLQVLRLITSFCSSYWFGKMGQYIMQKLRMDLFEKIQKLPFEVFSRVSAGKLVTRVTNDVSSLADMFSAGFVTILGNIMFLIGAVSWLLVLNWKLGLISISVLPLLIFVSVKFSDRLKIAYRTARAKLSALNAFFAENILGMRVIHLFNRQLPHFDKFLKLNNDYANAQFGSVRIFALFQPSITMATGIAMSLLIWYGGKDALQGHVTVGFLASYFAYLMSLFQPMREIADKWNIFLAGMASVERIYSILDWEPEPGIHEIESESQSFKLTGHIKFENVWFAYEGENWVLKDVNLEIQPGQKIGIVGPTGSGKSTIISLLLRFYKPQRGRILLDGKDLESYDKRRLRSSIGLIQQDVFLFSGSLSENMSLWREFDPNVRTQLSQMAAFRGLEEKGLEDEKLLNERGSNLSMGERQIVAFARALHTCPCIWILDEATANMDSETEHELEGLLKTAAQDKTLVMIAHRLSSVREAHQILVLQNGVLIESGTHSALIKRDGLYSKLYRVQELSI